MPPRRRLVTYGLIGLVVLAFLMAYFVRPKAPLMDFVSASQEIGPGEHLPSDQGLAARVSKSYGLALVLVFSDYSRKNAVALESLRSWARENFQRDPGFLHPAMPESPAENHQSIMDALFFNLCAAPLYVVEGQTVQFLKGRIADFHSTRAYESFREDYYSAFGKDKESALLLARYQSDRAASAVNVLVSLIFWICVLVTGMFAFQVAPQGSRSTKSQRMLAHFWLALSLFYFVLAWVQNAVPVLVSALICGFVGFYLRRPITVKYGEDKGLSLTLVTLSNRAVAVSYWLTLSLVAIQVMTWIKTGSLNDPDPITLLLSSFSGNFLQDPINSKRNLSRVVGALWVLSGAWVVWEFIIHEPNSKDVEEGLASLKDSSTSI